MPANVRHHLEFVAEVVALMHRVGAADALVTLRQERPAFHVSADGPAYHDTRAVFTVWAVDRLVKAGLSPRAVLWHPLVHADSAHAWWTAAVLESDAAADSFVASDLVLPGEPEPHEPGRDLVAA
jgi:hypothetical protein